MTDSNHPITPSRELIQQWLDEWMTNVLPGTAPQYIATQAAQWGANVELEACCEFANECYGGDYAAKLRRHRRPRPQSQAEEALEALNEMNAPLGGVTAGRCNTIRRALKRLQELEGKGDD